MYEEFLSQTQDAVEDEEWQEADTAFEEFVWHLKRHMAMEEEVLYPAYESRIRMPDGPTEALREEHDRIARVVTDMVRLLRTRDPEHVLNCLEQLSDLIIKHHEKEEDIFLPMASMLLESNREELLKELHSFDAGKIKRKWDI